MQKTNTISQERLTYIRDSFPMIDQFTMSYMGEASTRQSPPIPGQRQHDPAIEVYQQALKLYEQASKIPPADFESRAIIARSFHRMGFTRGVTWLRKQSNPTPDLPGLLAQAESDYRHSIKLFEELLAERPGDPEVRSWFADALGEWGYGWFLDMHQRPAEAEPHYRHAIQLSRDLAFDPGVDGPTRADELAKMGRVTGLLTQMLDDRWPHQGGRGTGSRACRTGEAADRARDTPRPGCPIGHYGTWLLQQNRRKDAADIFRLAVTVDPENTNLLNNLAWALASFAGFTRLQPSRSSRSGPESRYPGARER